MRTKKCKHCGAAIHLDGPRLIHTAVDSVWCGGALARGDDQEQRGMFLYVRRPATANRGETWAPAVAEVYRAPRKRRKAKSVAKKDRPEHPKKSHRRYRVDIRALSLKYS